MVVGIGVPGAGMMQPFKVLVREIKESAAQQTCMLRATRTVITVPAIVDAAAIVEKREQSHDHDIGPGALCQQQSISLYPPPMIRTMNGMRPDNALLRHVLPQDIDFIFAHGTGSMRRPAGTLQLNSFRFMRLFFVGEKEIGPLCRKENAHCPIHRE